MEEQINEVPDFVAKAQGALKKFEKLNQAQIDQIVDLAAAAARDAHAELAAAAVEETKRGVAEDKAIKNLFAAETVAEDLRALKTVGVISRDEVTGICEVAAPIGVIAGITPVTNPTSTTIFKALMCLKTRNPIIFAFHPGAQECSAQAAQIVLEAATAAGAPKDCIQWIKAPSVAATNTLMNDPGVALILATGGNAMVQAAYSCGKPAIGVGAGNVPSYIHSSAYVARAVNDIVMSKRFDHGVICASEQAVIADVEVADQALESLKGLGVYMANDHEKSLLERLMFGTDAQTEACETAKLNPNVVGKSCAWIAREAGFTVPETTPVILVKVPFIGRQEPLTREKLCPVLAFAVSNDTEEGIKMSEEMVELDGLGHTAVIHATDDNVIAEFGTRVKAIRIVENAPSSLGGIGGVYNSLIPSLTLGCGSYGHNSISDNVSARHLLNIKKIARRNNPVKSFRMPPELCFDPGAMRRVATMSDISRITVFTDAQACSSGHKDQLMEMLHRREGTISIQVIDDTPAEIDAEFITESVAAMAVFQPDTIIAIGRGPVMDAAKVARALHEYPHLNMADLSAERFPRSVPGTGCRLVCIPTSSGSRRAVTPLATVIDPNSGNMLLVNDEVFLPSMVIFDPLLARGSDANALAASAFETAMHATEAFASTMATDFTDGLCLHALDLAFKHAGDAVQGARENRTQPKWIGARDRVQSASALTGMALGNASLGLASAMARALETRCGLEYRVALAAIGPQVVRYNGQVPTRLSTNPGYEYYRAPECYAKIVFHIGKGEVAPTQAAEVYAQALEALRDKLGLSGSLVAAGLDQEAFARQAAELPVAAFELLRGDGNPRMPLMDEIAQLFTASM